MSLIGVLSSDEELNRDIHRAVQSEADKHHLLRTFSDQQKVEEFLNFDLPEIIILHIGDPALDLGSLLEKIRGESWLHNFGIIGLYSRKERTEEQLLEEFRDINVLTFLEQGRIKTHLHKIIHIIEDNWQIIFQQDITEKLVKKSAGAFLIDNDPLSVQVFAGLGATNLLQRGFITEDQRTQLQIALSELILNGIEHGNCGISMQEKEQFLLSGGSIIELIQEKCADQEIASKRVRFEWDTDGEKTVFTIRDQGEGFDVEALQRKLKAGGPETVNGRGIMMARKISRRLSYNKKGNVVRLEFAHQSDAERSAPAGFSDEETVGVQPGDIIFEEGETSDFLYYIASGHFGVFHAGSKVGKLSPADIFMGEMSFLLNNKRSAQVKAESRGKLVKISRKAFVSVVKEYPHYGIFLSKLIARKLARANTQSVLEAVPELNIRL